MPSRARRTDVRAAAVLAALVVLAGCTPVSDGVATGMTVTVTNDGCSVTPSTAVSGSVEFAVVNSSDEVAAVEVLSAGDSRGGIGNIAPGISRDLVLALGAGDYELACTPGPAANTTTTAFSVTGTSIAAPVSTAGVSESYLAWVHGRTAELREATDALATAFVAADPAAQQRYRDARALWASLLPVLERFPELLPAIDARESDLVVGEKLSGWHALERDLWPTTDQEPLDAAARTALSSRLQANLVELLDRVDGEAGLEPGEIAAGAQDLVDAASRALSDGDERWSHAELWLVQGDLDGATAAIDALRTVLSTDAPELLAEVDQRRAALQNALDTHASTRELATCIDALAAALSRVVRDARIEP